MKSLFKLALNTRLFLLFQILAKNGFKKINYFTTWLPLQVFTLFYGFFCGNIFVTFLNHWRSWVQWDGSIVFCLLLFFESLSYLAYKKKILFFKQALFKSNFRFFNYFKIGILFGIYIDAFKVGS